MKWKKCFENIHVSVVFGYMDVEVCQSFYFKLYSHQLMHFSHTDMYGCFKLIKST